MSVIKHITEIRGTTLEVIEKRRSGEITSFHTPWPKLDRRLLGGIDWGSLTLIGGKSGVGKTALADQMVNEAKKHNPDKNIPILKFQLEMTDEQTGIRELTGVTGLSMKQLYSVDNEFKLEDYHIENIKKYYEQAKEDPIWQISDSVTARQFEAAVLSFYEKHKCPFIVYFDHSILANKSADEGTLIDTLTNLCRVTNKLKKRMPVIFIFLTQMNRSLDDVTRKEDGRASNFPTKSDIYGSDALYQFADSVMVLMRPGMDRIKLYGAEKYKVTPSHMVLHLLKGRWDGEGILFFEEDLKHFKIKEADPPQRQTN